MVRKPPEDSEKTRVSILQSALNIFLEQGYSRSKLEDIASNAGVTRGALYWHFKNGKPDLYQSIMVEYGQGLEHLFAETAALTIPGKQKLFRLFGGWAHAMETDLLYRQTVHLMLFKTEVIPELERGMAEKKENMRLLQHTVAHWLIDDGINQDDATPLAELIIAASWGVMEHWLMMDRPYPLAARINSLLTRVLT